MSPKEDILEVGGPATPQSSERSFPIIAMKKGDRQVENPLVAVIDEGTRTARFAVFDPKTKNEVISHQVKISMISPSEGWFEQDPMDILGSVKECIREVTSQMAGKGFDVKDIVALGVTNQRETTIVWDKKTGEPLFNALVWYDIRTDSTVDQILAKLPDQNKDYLLPICGLPVSTYFSALKLRWLLDHVPAVRKAVQEQRCLFGTVDTWLIWNLTGGCEGGLHVTDVTNASRTMLMNIDTLEWDPTLCKIFKIPMEILPEIRSSSEICGYLTFPPLDGVPISGILGNQQAALVGQHCLQEGLSKNTYRSGCFLLYNTGHNRVLSTHGLVTTVAYQMGPTAKPVYALEGSVAVAGNAIKWLRDKLNVLSDISETESLAEEVMTTGDVYFVPAFNGLYAPYWRKDARGILCGLTQFTTKAHLIRAALEAVCFQTRDILEAMHADCGVPLQKLRVDGMMSQNSLLMQLQADLCGIPVVRAPHAADVTSLGVAMAAGWAHGVEVWDKDDQAIADVHGTTFEPVTNNEERNIRYTKWKMAVQRSLGWATHKRTVPITEERYRMIASVPGTLFCFTSFLMLVISEKVKNR